MKNLLSAKRLFLAFFLLLSIDAMGQTYVNIGDLKYQLNGTEAYVAGFATSEGVANVVIPETIESDGLTFNVTKINSYAFKDKTNLVSVKATSINDIDYEAFRGCTGLNSVEVINVYSIYNQAFYGCSNLQRVNFGSPGQLNRVGQFAFYGCTSLSYIVIPGTCRYYDVRSYWDNLSNVNDVFKGCNRLQAIIYLGDQTSKCGSNAAVYNAQNLGSFSSSTFDYNGSAPTPTFTYSGNVAGFQVTDYQLPTLNSNAGTYTATVPVTFANDDMDFTVDREYTYTINKVGLTAVVDNETRAYGEVNPTFSATFSGFVNGEDENVITSKTLSCTATSTSNVGDYAITLSNVQATNYTVTSTTNGTLTVTKAPLTMTAKNKSVTYGSNLPTLEATYTGLKNGETAPAWTTAPAITTTATTGCQVGEYPITITGAVARNYDLTVNGGTLTVTKKALTVRAANKSRTYGETNPELTVTYSGLVNGETEPEWVHQPVVETEATRLSSAGDYDIEVKVAEAVNYEVTPVKGTLTINKAALTIAPKSESRYYGDENPAFELEYAGLRNDEDAPEWVTAPTISTSATASSSVGTYNITIASGAVARNYTLTRQTGVLTVNKAPLQISVGNYTKQPGEPMPTFALTYEGFKNGQTKSVLSHQATVTCSANANSPAGEYPITLSNATASNYDISYVNGLLTVTAAELVTVTAKSYTITYGDALPTFDYTVSGATLNGTPQLQCTATSTSGAGTYPITVSSGTVQNYNVSYVSGTLTIEPAPLTISTGNYTRTVDEANPTFALSYDGFKKGETATVLTKQPTATTTATSASPKGVYPITVSGAEAQNYAISYVNGTLTVTDRVDTENVLAIDNAEVFTGKTYVLPIRMNNTAEITGLQMDLYLPTGVTVATNSKGKPIIEVTERMEEQYSLSSNVQTDGALRITGLQLDSEPFTGTEGAIVNVTLNIDEEMADDDYTVELKNIGLSDVTGTYHRPADVSATLTVKSYTLGDVDNSGDININDAVCIVNYILNKTLTTFVVAAADLDASGDININDPVVLINRFILHKTNARAKAPVQRAATADDNYLQIATVNMKPGETKTIAVEMKNTEGIIGTQCNIKLPEGLSFAYTEKKGKKVYTMALNDDRVDDHTLSANLQEDGSMTVTTISMGGETYYDNEGTLFTFDVVADADITPGGFELLLSDIVLSTGVAIKSDDRTSILNVIPDLDEDVAQFEISSDITEADVTLKRTIVAGKYNTLTIPFDLTDAQVKAAFGSDAKVYVFSNDTEGAIAFNSTTAGITANVPVLLKTSTEGSEYTFTGVTLKSGVAAARGNYFDFVGNYAGDVTLDEGVYFFNDDKLYCAADKSHLKGYRAYFHAKAPNGARSQIVVIDGQSTGMSTIDAEDEKGTAVYSLKGVRMKDADETGSRKLNRGVYIMKGKKIVVH